MMKLPSQLFCWSFLLFKCNFCFDICVQNLNTKRNHKMQSTTHFASNRVGQPMPSYKQKYAVFCGAGMQRCIKKYLRFIWKFLPDLRAKMDAECRSAASLNC